jgi:hypothetical protein
MRRVSELRIAADTAPAIADIPWASALNATVECDEISVTLLALDVVDGLLRLTGIVRVGDRPDIRVASIPQLEVAFPDAVPFPWWAPSCCTAGPPGCRDFRAVNAPSG